MRSIDTKELNFSGFWKDSVSISRWCGFKYEWQTEQKT